MYSKDKLKELAAAESAFNDANDSRSAAWDDYKAAKKVYDDPRAAAWDAYVAAEEVYGDSRIVSEFINNARAAARIDFIDAGVALDNANRAVKDAEQVINETREIK